MEKLRLTVEVEGFDRVLYDSSAQWDNFNLSVIDSGKGVFEAWADDIDDIEKVQSAIASLIHQIERFILSIEWAFGCELKYKITKVIAPSFATDANLLEIRERLEMEDQVYAMVAPRKVPESIPQVPLEAKRWIQVWVECTKFSEYVEEQLRRQYLIIEELWQELNQIFDATKREEKRQVKLIRDFVSHASCVNPDVISLIEHDLPSAVQVVNGKKQVSFKRTVEHRNYISRFEVKSREIARSLVDYKMKQLGIVSGV